MSSIKKSSSHTTAAPKRAATPKPAAKPAAHKAPEVKKDHDVAKKSETKKDDVHLSDEVKGHREGRRAGDAHDCEYRPGSDCSPKPGETEEGGKKPGETEEGKKPGEVDKDGNRVDKDGNRIDENGKKLDENGKPIDEDREQMKKEIEDIKGLLQGLTDNFKAKEEAGAEESSGGGESGGGSPSESGGGESKPGGPKEAQQAQQPQQVGGGALDTQLSQMAIQILSQGGMGMGNPQAGGFPQNMQNGNAQNGQLNINGGFQAQGQGGAAGLRNQLASIYAQSGGPGNKSVKPETHQLVQLALGLGGMNGMNGMGGMNGMNGLGGMNGVINAGIGGGFPTQMGMNPNFGGVQNVSFANFR